MSTSPHLSHVSSAVAYATRTTIAIAATLVIVGCTRSPKPEPTPPRAVRAVEVRPEAASPLAYAGSLEPKVKLDLAFGVGGRVRAIGTRRDDGGLVHEGDVVTKGQLLAELDAADLHRQAVSAALAATGAASEVKAAEASSAQANADLARVEHLAATGAVPPAELERVQLAAKAAYSRLDTLRSQHGAKLEQLAIAQRAEGDSRLASPITGVVARRMIDAGERVGPSTVAFTIIDTTEMKLVFAVPDSRVGEIRLGALVPVHAEALPGLPLVARVTTIHPVADPALRTFAVEVSIANGDGKLRAGMVASASLGDEATPSALVIPLASVVRAPDGALAVFSVAGDRATLRRVAIGDLVGNDVIVESGVGRGDRVVTDGAALLHDGEIVDVLP